MNSYTALEYTLKQKKKWFGRSHRQSTDSARFSSTSSVDEKTYIYSQATDWLQVTVIMRCILIGKPHPIFY